MSKIKNSKWLLFVVGVGAVVLIFIAIFSNLQIASLNAIAASLAVIASALAAWSSMENLELMQEQLNPNITVFFDMYSRYSFVQLCIKNIGGSTAYNIKFNWIEKELVDYNGTTVFFYKQDDPNGITILQPDEVLYSKVNVPHKVFEDEDLNFVAKLTYTDGHGKNFTKNIMVSLEHYRGSLTYVKEETKAVYQLSKLDEQVKKITLAINNLTNEVSKLGGKEA